MITWLFLIAAQTVEDDINITSYWNFRFYYGKKMHIINHLNCLKNIYILIWLHTWILNLSCGMWDLVLWPGVKPGPPALGVQCLGHWSTGQVPILIIFNCTYCSVALSTLVLLCSHHHHPSPEHFHYSKLKLCTC